MMRFDQFRLSFHYALKDLAWEVGHYEGDIYKPNLRVLECATWLFKGYKIPGTDRAVQDRFAYLFTALKILPPHDKKYWVLYDSWKEKIFETWLDWNRLNQFEEEVKGD